MENVILEHGKGGAKAQELLGDLFLKYLSSPVLHCLEDSALLEEHSGRIAFSTNCYTSDPLSFPGGNIGSLAVYGTINNLAMRGAMPLALSLAVVLEEGFSLTELEKVICSIGLASSKAEVAVVTGDTKVVPRGKMGGICLNISGIGLVNDDRDISGANIEIEDAVIVTGNIGEHGLAVEWDGTISTFCSSGIQPLHFVLEKVQKEFPGVVHALRDPTRGGLATSLVWLASASGICLEVEEASVPISADVRRICHELDKNPFHLNSEGTCIICCESEYAMEIVSFLQEIESSRNARIIGHASKSPMGRVRFHKQDGTTEYLEAMG